MYPSGSEHTVELIKPWGLESPQSHNQFRHSVKSIFFDKLLRSTWFPGVVQFERPARGSMTCPDPSAITNHSTLTLNDGISGAVVFEFLKSGPVGPGNQAVDISGAVTPSDVATDLANAISTWVASLGIAASGDGRGFLTRRDGAVLHIVQAFPHKNASTSHGQPARGSWFGKTSGDLGNFAILSSNPGDGWAGHIFGMTGGRNRKPGCMARVAGPGRAQALSNNLPVIR